MIEEGLQREHALSVTSLPSDEERREEMKRKKELLHLLFPSLSSNALLHTTFEYDPNLRYNSIL